MNITVRSTLARDPNVVDAYSASHPICQEFGPFRDRTPEQAVAFVESLFAKVMQPGESLTLEVMS